MRANNMHTSFNNISVTNNKCNNNSHKNTHNPI